MKKYAIDCTHFIKGEVGGFESYLLNLLEGLAELVDHDITLFILSSQSPFFERFENQFKIKKVRSSGRYQRIFWQNFILPFYSISFSVILFPANFRPLVLFCQSLTVIHDLQYVYFPEYWSASMLLYRKIFIPISIYRSAKIVTISESVKKEILDNFNIDGNRVNVIYNPISVAGSTTTKYPSVSNLKNYILIPSSLFPHKNISALVGSIEKTKPNDESVQYVFIGPFKTNEFGIIYESESIKVLGYVETAMRDSLFYNCKAIIIPSIYEGFGMPYIEAVLNKKPILVCDIPVAREILGDYASYINPPFGENEIKFALDHFLSSGINKPFPSKLSGVSFLTDPKAVAVKYMDVLQGS